MTAIGERVRGLKGSEYDVLVNAGVFEDEKLELLEGQLVTMTPKGTEHDGAIEDLTALLSRGTAGRANVRVQCAFAATDDSRPEPDLALVSPESHRRAHPTRAFLIVEIAASSLSRDRRKAALYARAGVGEYWVVDLVHRAVEVYRAPKEGRYEVCTTHRRPEVLRLVAFPDVEIPLDVVLAD